MINTRFIIEELKKKNILSDAQVEEAKKESKKTGMPLDKALIKKGSVTENDIAAVVSEQIGVPLMDISDYLIDTAVIKLVPEALAQKYRLIPLFKIGNTLTIAMADPRDLQALDKVKAQSKCEVEPVLATESSIRSAIDQYYGVSVDIEEVIKGKPGGIKAAVPSAAAGKESGNIDLDKLADAPPVIRLVNLIIMEALKDKASDIHIEPDEDILRVRYRVDGILREGPKPPQEWAQAIVSRIKVLAQMNIAEKRKPQDGRMQLNVAGRNIDLRISTFPTVYGENLVLRILDRSSLLLGLSDLGMGPGVLKEFEALIRRPYGIILVTGPTGGGKTTTLYAALSTINSVEKNIITIEDPVEYRLHLIRQTQVNPQAGLTFATGLRSIVRQDPDIIMVGEIRDAETAEIATHAALTGHLVFSTLHTNDAAGAISRLIDMGIEPFLVASSLIGVLAQRLVRVICPKCREKITPTKEMLKDLGISHPDKVSFSEGKGCHHCKDSGYTGRIGIYELLLVDDEIKKLIVAKTSAADIKKRAMEHGMVTLHQDGMEKAAAGSTSIEEVLRVTQE